MKLTYFARVVDFNCSTLLKSAGSFKIAATRDAANARTEKKIRTLISILISIQVSFFLFFFFLPSASVSTIIVSASLSVALLVLGAILFAATKAYLLITRTNRHRHHQHASSVRSTPLPLTSTQLAERDRVLVRVKSMHFQRFLVPFVRFWTAPHDDAASTSIRRRRRRAAAAVFVTDETTDASVVTMRLEIVFDAALDRFLRSHRLASLIPSARRAVSACMDDATSEHVAVIVSSQSMAQLRAQASEAYACVVRVPLVRSVSEATAMEEFESTALMASWKSNATSESVSINVKDDHRD